MKTNRSGCPICGGWKPAFLLACGLWLGACTATRPPALSPGHLGGASPSAVSGAEEIPRAITRAPVLPPPEPAPPVETYTVVVNGVPVRDLLFELARDAKLNVDIHPDIHGSVTLNAVNQTFPQIMDRIARQVDLRYQLNGPNLVVSPDTPYWRSYPIDYVNLSRDSVSEVSVATQIATTGGSVGENSGSSRTGLQNGNISSTKLTNTGKNHFWDAIEANIRAILGIGASGEGASVSGETDSGGDGPLVISNPMSGIISVRAARREHEQIQAFLDKVMNSALRQVLIEMTIVEVELSDRYQAGVDWQTLATGSGLTLLSSLTGANLATAPFFSLGYTHTTGSGRTISSTLRMLETFGNVKVLSSPKVMTLNNQTALLKVVDEKVYFTVEREIVDATINSPARENYFSEIHTVPVGLVMSVTSQITEGNNVAINVRPSISRITGYALDPVPKLLNANFDNLIPEIQVREMESLLQVADGQTVVMGGLMQNKISKDRDGVPGTSETPVVGDLLSYRDEEFTKTELVIFLRPTVIKGAGLGFDLERYRGYLPDAADREGAPDKWLRAERGQ